MNNERYNQIIDEAYENYLKNFVTPICPPNLDVQPDYYMPMTREWFAKSAKERGLRGEEFSERWGLKIEERELMAIERWDLYGKHGGPNGEVKFVGLITYKNEESNQHIHEWLDKYAPNIPTKLITLTYKDETIEVYV